MNVWQYVFSAWGIMAIIAAAAVVSMYASVVNKRAAIANRAEAARLHGYTEELSQLFAKHRAFCPQCFVVGVEAYSQTGEYQQPANGGCH